MPGNVGLWDPGGPVAAAAAARRRDYVARDGQAQMSAVVTAALERQATQRVGLVTIEAATGTGKTLGYLIPGILHAARTGTRMLVSTHTVELGRQLVEEDGPLAADVAFAMTGKRPVIAQVRGRRHFLSPSRTRAAGNLMRDDGAPASRWQPYLDAAAAVDELLDAASETDAPSGAQAARIINAALISSIEADLGASFDHDDVCMLASSPDAELALSRLSRSLAASASVLVSTHAYVATALARRDLMGAEQDGFGIAVIDEADQWRSAAASVSMLSVSMDSLRRSIEALASSARHKPKAAELVEEAESAVRRIEALVEAAPSGRGISQPLGAGDPVMAAIARIGGRLSKLGALSSGFRSHTASAADALREHARDLAAIRQKLAQRDSDFWQARWSTSQVTGRPSISVTSRAPGRIMKRLWAAADGEQPLARTIVLTSATLQTPGFGDASRWKSLEIATGFDAPPGMAMADLACSIEPKSFGSMRVRFADPRAPVPRVSEDGSIDGEALSYAAGVVLAAMESSRQRGGRTLVLVPSYGMAAQLVRRVPGCLEHRRGIPLQAAVEEYMATPGCCLVTPGAWVGVNLPGMVQDLVIPRIPFVPSSDDMANGARMMSDTLQKLQQGIGRGIRGPSDDVTVWFADPRMPLPECVTEETGLMSHPSSSAVLLATIPRRFRSRFGTDPTAASIGVAYVGARRRSQQASRARAAASA